VDDERPTAHRSPPRRGSAMSARFEDDAGDTCS
jgi:hypothetical protein